LPVFINIITLLGYVRRRKRGDQAATSSNYDSNSIDGFELIEDNSSDEEIEETPSQSAVPSSNLRLRPNMILLPQRKNQDQVQ
jgi:hypothetical protein